MLSTIRARYLSVAFFLVIFFLTNLCPHAASAQDLITTMLKQIALLETTLQEAKQGYEIVRKGLSIIGDIKEGDFNLHNDYFSSLSSVKGPIKNYARAADMVRMQATILNDCRTTTNQLSFSGLYSAIQLAYCSRVFASLSVQTGRDMEELAGILADNQWQMTDDERLARMDDLYKRVAEKYSFCLSFCNQVRAVGALRSSNLQSDSTLNKLF